MNRTDSILLGVTLGFAASYVLAKGLLFRDPRVRALEASAFYGKNPILVKSGIAHEVMTRVSIFLAFASAILIILGTFLSLHESNGTSYFLSSWKTLVVFFAISAVLIYLLVRCADIITRVSQKPALLGLMSKGFEDVLFRYRHDGHDKRLVDQGHQLTDDQKMKNLEDAKRSFRTWALLFDIPFDEENGDYEKLIKELEVIAESKERLPQLNIGLSAEWIQAVATVVLVGITAVYVIYTNDLVKQQKHAMESQQEQFQMVNRPRVIPLSPEGEPSGGQVGFANLGNLPAENVSIAWCVFQADDKSSAKELVIKGQEFSEIAPDDVVSVDYASKLVNSDPGVFLVLGVQYDGNGISHTRSYTDFFFWNIHRNPPFWVRPNPLELRLVEAVALKRQAVATFLDQSKNPSPQEAPKSPNRTHATS